MKEVYKAPQHLIYGKKRLGTDFSGTRGEKMVASYEDFLRLGLRRLYDQGLYTKLSESESGYATFSCIGITVVTPYDLNVFTLPKKEKPIITTLDKLPSDARKNTILALEEAVQTIKKTSITNNEHLARIYITQHIGPDEINNYPFASTFPYIHFHVSGITEEFISSIDPNADRSILRTPSNKYIYSDPTITIAYDFIRSIFPQAKMDSFTDSIILSQRKRTDHIDDTETADYIKVMELWPQLWKKVASCFTDFTTDENERYIPLPKESRIKKVNELIQQYSSVLSSPSKQILKALAKLLRNFQLDEKSGEVWKNNFYKGISGSMGLTFDYTTNLVALRFAPRLFVATEKYGATDGFLLSEKTNDQSLPLDKIFKVHKQLYEMISKKNALISILLPYLGKTLSYFDLIEEIYHHISIQIGIPLEEVRTASPTSALNRLVESTNSSGILRVEPYQPIPNTAKDGGYPDYGYKIIPGPRFYEIDPKFINPEYPVCVTVSDTTGYHDEYVNITPAELFSGLPEWLDSNEVTQHVHQLCKEKNPQLKKADHFDVEHTSWEVFETLARIAHARKEFKVEYSPRPETITPKDNIGKWAYHVIPLK